MINRIMIEIQHGSAVSGIGLVQRQEIRVFLLQTLHDAEGVVFTAVVGNDQLRLIAFGIDLLAYGMPLLDHILDVRLLVVGRQYKINNVFHSLWCLKVIYLLSTN